MKNRFFFFVLLFCIVLAGTSHVQNGDSYDYDVLIKNGKVFDGSLKPAFGSDVAIKGGRIVRVAKSIEGTAARTIDAQGLHVAPGFIDLHTHAGGGMTLPENRPCLNYLHQGVTTLVVGLCGSSGWPLFEKAEDQMKRWSEEGIGPNAVLLVGHETVRQIVMGTENREPTAEELDKMRALVKEAMEQGAYGLSTGLEGSAATTDEIVQLVKVIEPYGGIYHTHMRNEEDKLLEAVEEAIEISRRTGAPAHISHLKAWGKPYWGSVNEACEAIEKARAQGLRITADQYPYQFSDNCPYRKLVLLAMQRLTESPSGGEIAV